MNGNLDVALQLAQTAKAQLPTRHEVDDTLGYIYYKKGLSSMAIEALSASTSRQPDNPSYNYHLALAYHQSGNTAEAKKLLAILPCECPIGMHQRRPWDGDRERRSPRRSRRRSLAIAAALRFLASGV